ncbi:MAG: tetratricopeptide repeat protein [Sphingomonadales bacterium]|nr:tetratricopeptide repeat protein [Sphingomonadales bacterium]
MARKLLVSTSILALASCAGSAEISSNDSNPAAASPTIVLPNCSIDSNSPAVQAYCLFNSAVLLLNNGYPQRAKQEFLQVIALDDTRIDPYIFLGDIYFAEGDLTQAEQMYAAASRLDPDNARLYYNLGVVYDSAGRAEQAIASYMESIELSPGNAQAHYSLGLAYARDLDSLENATASFLRAVELDPSMADAHFSLGQVYEYQRRPGRAREHYARAVELGHPQAAEKLQEFE